MGKKTGPRQNKCADCCHLAAGHLVVSLVRWPSESPLRLPLCLRCAYAVAGRVTAGGNAVAEYVPA